MLVTQKKKGPTIIGEPGKWRQSLAAAPLASRSIINPTRRDQLLTDKPWIIASANLSGNCDQNTPLYSTPSDRVFEFCATILPGRLRRESE